jgi:hypothetical protein
VTTWVSSGRPARRRMVFFQDPDGTTLALLERCAT